MNVKYYNLYKEKDGKATTYYIPVHESEKYYSVVGFMYTEKWEYNEKLVNPEDWDEISYSDESFLKIVEMENAPDKEGLIKSVFEEMQSRS